MLSEFELIAKYFTRLPRAGGQTALGVGDDCALLELTPGMQLAVSTDMLVADRHFFADCDAFALGHKALAVNLSDLAAMGARPLAFTLALALPDANEEWLKAFSAGMFALADRHECDLIGGDTTRGPLNICITVFGEVAPSLPLRRDRALAGDDIWVSGTLGDARLALAGLRGDVTLEPAALEAAAERLHRPQPRIALGLALRGIARAAVDVSDGLAGDLGHILERSGVGATLDADALPAGPVLARQPDSLRRAFALNGGDDYELCFTAAPAAREAVSAAGAESETAVTRIGSIEAAPGLRLLDRDGRPLTLPTASFDHFATS
jgi:thiamine-monophosphate kinase